MDNSTSDYTCYLSIVIPVYNEEESLKILHDELASALRNISGKIEYIYINDGSSDGSADILRDIADEDYRVNPLHFDCNHGQSAALHAGFSAAKGEIIVTLDADLQNDPRDIPRLIGCLDKADVVNGIRIQRKDRWLRRSSSRIANSFRNFVTGENITDIGCSLRVIRSSYLNRVKLYRGMHRFLPTLLRIEGARVVEIPVNHRSRRFGQTKYGISDRLWIGLIDLMAVRWMQRRSFKYHIKRSDN